ncbi:hypothetical protein FOVG_17486 [Fusarium oxysporum f. sp. pisi HDV247]|uniref:Zn(2)-C6 fungal-type domain-containing protein n=1 Tax=Fusarium oxysporum f. sp. pisi HDV247 TaxID=1080344 RepID=W9NTX7_FUSOX|nr:hypothetical protein FOVG_17486 [Fusarium oxysporum f. sp. pisi HDV247]
MPTDPFSSDSTASRQKNCDSCVRVKRRCDRRTPICSRCAAKHLRCNYGKTKRLSRAVGQHQHTEQSSSTDEPPLISSDFTSFAHELTLNYDFLGDLPLHDLPTAPTTAGNVDSDPVMVVNGTNDIPIDPQITTAHSNDLVVQQQDPAFTSDHRPVEMVKVPVDDECVEAYRSMTSFCHNIQSWHAYDPKKPLNYLIARYKALVNDIVTHNATPFLHQHLYRDNTPPCILTCFMTAVLYANRTKTNMSMVMQALHERALDFVSTEVSCGVATPIRRLARTQTLFIYQIIRLLDGDVILRSRSEKDTSLLEIWLDDLCEIRDNLDDATELSAFLLRKAPDWDQWVFAESLRRTIVLGYSFITLYRVMKDMKAAEDPGAWAYIHRWTLSRHLWEAASSSHFERMWNERPRFVISNYSFASFLEKGRGGDVDSFAEILLNSYLGVDQTADFVSVKDT